MAFKWIVSTLNGIDWSKVGIMGNGNQWKLKEGEEVLGTGTYAECKQRLEAKGEVVEGSLVYKRLVSHMMLGAMFKEQCEKRGMKL